MRYRGASLCALAFAAAACQGLLDIDDIAFDEQPPDTSVGGEGGSGGGEGGSGAGVGGDAATTSSVGGSLEDCLDGADNDGDGDVDCADSDCVDHVCVPLGSREHLRLIPGTDGCADPLTIGGLGIDSGDVSCTGCTCQNEVDCSNHPIGLADDGDCSPLDSNMVYGLDVCVGGLANNLDGAVLGPSQTPLTSCTTTPANLVIDTPASISELHAVCTEKIGGGCAGDQVCVAPLLTGELRCTASARGGGCPAERAEVNLIEGIADERTCAACNCNVAMPAECQVTTTFFGDVACGNPQVAYAHGSPACRDINGAKSLMQNAIVISNGTCDVSGGDLVGVITAPDVAGFCCTSTIDE